MSLPAFIHALGIRLEPVPPPWVDFLFCPTDPMNRWSITHQEGLILMAMAVGRNVLEIGTGLGVSTAYLAQGTSSVTTIDPDPWSHEQVQLPESVTRYRSILEVDPSSYFEVVFIDGKHDRESVICDIQDVEPFTDEWTAWVFHDVMLDGVRAALDAHRDFWHYRVELPTPAKMTVCCFHE